MKLRLVVGTATFASLVLVLAACTSDGSTTSNTSGSASSAAGGAYDPAHAGGTLTLLAKSAGGTLDPQINYTLQYWQLYQAAYDGLTSFKKVDGADSFTVVPDLAEKIPQATRGGKTYVFTMRKGIKFSDGTPVTTDDVVASFQRIFKVSSPTAGSFYNGIVGADACLNTPATCTLAGGVVGDKAAGTVTINLTAPDPEFLYKLSVPHASILPASAPSKDAGTTPIPTTGPYMFKSYDPNTSLVMVRNPYFKLWSQDAQPQAYADEIDYKFGLTVEAEVTAVENGQANWLFDPPPADRLAEIGSEYASQAHVNTLTAYWYAPMNVNIPPFNNVKARQAVNWAIDRNALVKLYGGPELAAPVCTILPPDFPGHVDNCQYTNPAGSTWQGPDLAKAKQLVQESGTAGQPVTIIVSDDEVNAAMGEYLQSVLNSIGYKATVKAISGNVQFTYIQNTKNNVQISLTSWYQDYPAASDFLNVLLGCASFTPGSDSSINIAGFCDKTIQAQMDAALKTEQTSMDAANKQWAAVDQAVMTASPQAPLITPKLIDFLSADTGNYQFSKQFYMLVSQLWVK
ncbi:MAG: ABC transporter substrate-binding protein [Actinomycetia bacterium]|nr:ABC transporter substrate-binding protein [Actinomycetes bacterium]